MAEKFANEFQTTLSAAITDTVGTSISVAAPAPAALQGGEFRVRIGDELMLVTATGGSGASPWTVTRGIEGTAAATHLSGAVVAHVLTAGSLAQAVESGSAEDVAFTPAGGISATNVQDAIEEVAAEAGSGGSSTGTTIGTVALDGSGNPVLTVTSIWGINSSGNPYYDPAGATAGEDAILEVADDGSLTLTTITGQVP